jgi:hypothetical protein
MAPRRTRSCAKLHLRLRAVCLAAVALVHLLHLRPRPQAVCSAALALLHLGPRPQAVCSAALLHLRLRLRAVCLAAAALVHLLRQRPQAAFRLAADSRVSWCQQDRRPPAAFRLAAAALLHLRFRMRLRLPVCLAAAALHLPEHPLLSVVPIPQAAAPTAQSSATARSPRCFSPPASPAASASTCQTAHASGYKIHRPLPRHVHRPLRLCSALLLLAMAVAVAAAARAVAAREAAARAKVAAAWTALTI